MNWEIGIDEAGRGPCIGPMVYGCVAIAEPNVHLIDNQHIRDSKLLSDTQRKYASDIIVNNAGSLFYGTEEISAKEISRNMLSGVSLNSQATTVATLLIIKALRYIYKHDKDPQRIDVQLDTLSGDTESYANIYREDATLQSIFTQHFPNTKCKITAYIKGDSLYKVISAASILAKELREQRVSELQKQYGDFGSGYPSDKKTINWIEKNFPSPADEVCRTTWKTWKIIEEKKRVSV